LIEWEAAFLAQGQSNRGGLKVHYKLGKVLAGGTFLAMTVHGDSGENLFFCWLEKE
jgi:hypothetical protein